MLHWVCTNMVIEQCSDLNCASMQQAQFLDYGRHSEAVELRWVLVRDDAGRPVAQRLERAVLAAPRPRHVPHFGCVPCGFPLPGSHIRSWVTLSVVVVFGRPSRCSAAHVAVPCLAPKTTECIALSLSIAKSPSP